LKRRHTFGYALNGFAGNIPPGRLRALQGDPRVEFVEPDQTVFAFAQTVPTGVNRIGALSSAAAKIDGLDDRVDVDIAIIDTGIDLTHPDLNVYQGVSFSANNTTGNDGHGHGTHVAGTAAALDNNIGVVGVAPGARLWAVKALDDTGSGALSAIIAAVDYVTQHATEIEVANMSLGGQGSSDSLRLAIQRSVAAGVVYVVAAGNSGFEVYGGDDVFGTWDDFFPASYPEVMTVSALVDTDGQAGGTGSATSYGADDTLATFSNYSKTVVAGNPVTSPGAAIDVAAPGVNILSTYKGGVYATMSGTSMASPHVAGAVALYISRYGRASDAAGVASIRQALINSAEPQSGWGVNPTNPNFFKDFNPEGLINVANIGSTPGPPQPPANNSPQVSIIDPIPQSVFDSGAAIQFTGSGSDVEDGNLTGNLAWNSDLDGDLGTGGNLLRTLRSGTHKITAHVTDTAGNTSTASVTVTVMSPPNNLPIVSITSPAGGSVFDYGVPILFSGSASDQEDGDVSANLVWTSDRDGEIGNGSSFQQFVTGGTHNITARVTDSGGNTTTALVTVTVIPPPNTAPDVSIISPGSGSVFNYGAAILFSGTASDLEDGNLNSKLVWTSDRDGQIGTGGSFQKALSSGTHNITARVIDSLGIITEATVIVTVGPKPNTPPVVSILSPSNGATINSSSVSFKGTGSDVDDGDLTTKLVWSSSVNGLIGKGGSFTATLASGSHTITAQVTDASGATSSKSITITISPRGNGKRK
jgi:subtilisin family serine protease